MRTTRSARLLLLALLTAACGGDGDGDAPFSSAIPPDADRVWVGPDYYANRLQDWRIVSGRIESVEGRSSKPMRTLHLLTRALGEASGTVRMSVRTGPVEPGPRHADTWSGFLVGVGGEDVDYRISALAHHWPSDDGGLIVAMDGTGRIVVRDNSVNQGYRGPAADIPLEAWPLIEPDTAVTAEHASADVVLSMDVRPSEGGFYELRVTAEDSQTGERVAWADYSAIPGYQLSGNVALVSHRSPRLQGTERRPGYWFRDWRVAGTKVEGHDERAFGPVMGALHTLSRGILKMTAQMGPLGPSDPRTVALEIRVDTTWTTVATAEIQELSYTAHFRVDPWDSGRDTHYRIVYAMGEAGDSLTTHYFEGTVRRPPVGKEELVLAAFTGQQISGGDGRWNSEHFWYPHSELTSAVAAHDPDVLFFSGDQVYEGGLAGVVREPGLEASLDYLNHWYRFVWAFRDLTRDRPTVATPDDHDVYHGNIWGNGGVRVDGDFSLEHDRGGYRMEPEWVNAVHRTQVAHLPDPVDPEPLSNGITVYHTRMEYAGVSFAIVADRMFKSPPAVVVPVGDVVNGWPQNPDFDAAREADVPGAVLLGERQLAFLERWAADWSDGAWMKVLLSQSPFVDVATIPEDATSGAVLPGLPIPRAGEYIQGEKKATDMDSNGWPQSGRNRAVRALRRGFAFHVAGDQHLAFFVRYGVDDWNDAGYAFAVPAIANLWPRRWYPPEGGRNRAPGALPNTGDFLDGFGNHMRVLAVANPAQVAVEPRTLYERAPGYGIVRFNRRTRDIVTENWPRWMDPLGGNARQYPGWPITVNQMDNYDRPAAAHLPTVVVEGMRDPVIQVSHEATGEVLYTVRILGDRYRPRVFRRGGSYTVVVGEPGTSRLQTFTGIVPGAGEEILVRFEQG